jgi:rod shape-determining protein MreD
LSELVIDLLTGLITGFLYYSTAMHDQQLESKIDGLWQWIFRLLALGLCALALYARLPFMTLLGLSPNWLLIWLVIWSINRSVFLAAIAGVSLGLLQDAMTIPSGVDFAPTHIIGMAIAGALTALLQKERYIQENFISIALIVFGMAVISETAIAIQLTLFGQYIAQIWELQQRTTLGSAILSSMWSPVLHFPLSRLTR